MNPSTTATSVVAIRRVRREKRFDHHGSHETAVPAISIDIGNQNGAVKDILDSPAALECRSRQRRTGDAIFS
jgi:hypothetical protein